METNRDINDVYFSIDDIATQCVKQNLTDSFEKSAPLLDVARKTIELMRKNGRSEEEIQKELKTNFHFSAPIIDALCQG